MSIVNHSRDFRPSAQARSNNRSSANIVAHNQTIASFKRASTVLFTFALLATVFGGVIALRAAIWLHTFRH